MAEYIEHGLNLFIFKLPAFEDKKQTAQDHFSGMGPKIVFRCPTQVLDLMVNLLSLFFLLKKKRYVSISSGMLLTPIG